MTLLNDAPASAAALGSRDVLDDAGRNLLFNTARTANTFSPEPVSDSVLESVWELAKWPPTAANTQPMRVQFIRTEAGKARLIPLLSENNRAKSAAAPVIALLAADVDFHEYFPQAFPARAAMKDVFEANGRDSREQMARFNSALQAGYFVLAARAHGLAVGPMGGFDAPAVDAEFWPEGRHKTILVVNLGIPGENPWFDRLPRLDHRDVISWS